jgi:hypothetical protein
MAEAGTDAEDREVLERKERLQARSQRLESLGRPGPGAAPGSGQC